MLGASPPGCQAQPLLSTSPGPPSPNPEPSPALLGFMLRGSLFSVSEDMTLTPGAVCTGPGVFVERQEEPRVPSVPGGRWGEPGSYWSGTGTVVVNPSSAVWGDRRSRGTGCSPRPAAEVLCWLWELIGQEAGPA